MVTILQRYLRETASLKILFNNELCPSEVDRLEDELLAEQDKLKSVSEELEQTFAEMSGY